MSLNDIPHSYEIANRQFQGRKHKGRQHRTIADNTYLTEIYGCTPAGPAGEQVHGIGLTFHRTRIIEFYANGWIFLHPYYSVSTNERYDRAEVATLYKLPKPERGRVADQVRWRDPQYPNGVPMAAVWGYRVGMNFRIAGLAQASRLVAPEDHVYVDDAENQRHLRRCKRDVERVIKPYYAAIQMNDPTMPDWEHIHGSGRPGYEPDDIEAMAQQANQIRDQGLGIDALSHPLERLDHPKGLLTFAGKFKACTPKNYIDHGDFQLHKRVTMASEDLVGQFWKQ